MRSIGSTDSEVLWSAQAKCGSGRLRAASALFVLAVGHVVSGCISGSERPELNLEIPATYRAAPKRNAEVALPAVDWWRGFNSRELTSLMDAAQLNNLDIAVAIAQIVQADAQVGIAGAPLLPSLTGAASAEHAHFGPTARASRSLAGGALGAAGGAAGGTGAADTGAAVGTARRVGEVNFSVFSTSLTASYMLDFWGKNRAALYAAEESATASRYNREVVTLTAIVTVANTYFQVLTAQDQLRVTRQNLAAAERIFSMIRDRFANGTASQLDVSQQEALAATQRAAIPPLEVTLGQNRAALAVLVGHAPANLSVHGGSTSRIAVPRITPGLPAELLYQRPDIRLVEAQLAASNFSVEEARAAFFPQIQLTGTTGFLSTALASLFTPGAWFYTLTSSLTQPIFDGFLLESQLKHAKGVQLQNLQAYRKAVLSAFSDVEKALIALQKFTLQERLQAQVVTSSRKAFEIAETQLRGGTVNLVTVLQTEQTLFNAENTLVQVRLSKLLAASSLFQALGGGWTPSGTLAALQ